MRTSNDRSSSSSSSSPSYDHPHHHQHHSRRRRQRNRSRSRSRNTTTTNTNSSQSESRSRSRSTSSSNSDTSRTSTTSSRHGDNQRRKKRRLESSTKREKDRGAAQSTSSATSRGRRRSRDTTTTTEDRSRPRVRSKVEKVVRQERVETVSMSRKFEHSQHQQQWRQGRRRMSKKRDFGGLNDQVQSERENFGQRFSPYNNNGGGIGGIGGGSMKPRRFCPPLRPGGRDPVTQMEEKRHREAVIQNWRNMMREKIQRDRRNNRLEFQKLEMKYTEFENEKKAFAQHMKKMEAQVEEKLEFVANEEKRHQETVSHCQWWDKRLRERETKLLGECIKYEQHLTTLNERTRKNQEEEEWLKKKHLMLVQEEIRLQKEKQILLDFVSKCSTMIATTNHGGGGEHGEVEKVRERIETAGKVEVRNQNSDQNPSTTSLTTGQSLTSPLPLIEQPMTVIKEIMQGSLIKEKEIEEEQNTEKIDTQPMAIDVTGENIEMSAKTEMDEPVSVIAKKLQESMAQDEATAAAAAAAAVASQNEGKVEEKKTEGVMISDEKSKMEEPVTMDEQTLTPGQDNVVLMDRIEKPAENESDEPKDLVKDVPKDFVTESEKNGEILEEIVVEKPPKKVKKKLFCKINKKPVKKIVESTVELVDVMEVESLAEEPVGALLEEKRVGGSLEKPPDVEKKAAPTTKTGTESMEVSTEENWVVTKHLGGASANEMLEEKMKEQPMKAMATTPAVPPPAAVGENMEQPASAKNPPSQSEQVPKAPAQVVTATVEQDVAKSRDQNVGMPTGFQQLKIIEAALRQINPFLQNGGPAAVGAETEIYTGSEFDKGGAFAPEPNFDMPLAYTEDTVRQTRRHNSSAHENHHQSSSQSQSQWKQKSCESSEESYWKTQAMLHEERVFADKMWKMAEEVEAQRGRISSYKSDTNNNGNSSSHGNSRRRREWSRARSSSKRWSNRERQWNSSQFSGYENQSWYSDSEFPPSRRSANHQQQEQQRRRQHRSNRRQDNWDGCDYSNDDGGGGGGGDDWGNQGNWGGWPSREETWSIPRDRKGRRGPRNGDNNYW